MNCNVSGDVTMTSLPPLVTFLASFWAYWSPCDEYQHKDLTLLGKSLTQKWRESRFDSANTYGDEHHADCQARHTSAVVQCNRE